MPTIWDFWATHYNSLWVQRVSLGPTRSEIIQHLTERQRCKLLDVGCGTGQLFGDIRDQLPNARIDYLGIDASPAMIEVAKRNNPEGTFMVSSIMDFLAVHNSYDVIVCAHAFPYFPDKAMTLFKLKTMLKPRGSLLLAQASTNNLLDWLVLSFVKLTTSRAQYLSINAMRTLAAPVFPQPSEAVRINRSRWIPSIYLFNWTLP
ncbi:class I SAM-dependent methyltransferase [candidate division KSB1 bacterium]|nr:class I SAM-dependent methyltransferase [candidate division KSB1 bacterium]